MKIYLTKKEKENLEILKFRIEIVSYNRKMTKKFIVKILKYLKYTAKTPARTAIILPVSYYLDGLRETNTDLIFQDSKAEQLY